MNFSEVFKQTYHLCKFSPNGLSVANALNHRLMVRDVNSLEFIHIFDCSDDIEKLEWSPDSSLILCAILKQKRIHVWSLHDPDWTCKIDEGSIGLIDVRWTPDSRHILSTADFHIRITVWSLVNKTVSYMKYPKAVDSNTSFSHDGNYLALLERRNCKDCITIFSCASWQLLKHFEPETSDAAGICFAPDGHKICIWESLFEYKIVLYTTSGHCIASFAASDVLFGIKTLSWSPSSQFLALGRYDQKIHVLNNIIWKPVVEFKHNEVVGKSSVIIYKEVEKLWKSGMESHLAKYEIVVDRPVNIPALKCDMNKANQKIGISVAIFSPDNRYLMTLNDNMPTSLWIWNIEDLELKSMLIQIRPIKTAVWDPLQTRIALCTGSNKIYLWTPAGCTAVQVPSQVNFEVCSISWNPRSDCLVLLGKDQLCLCYLE